MIREVRGYLVRCKLPEAQGNASGFYDERSSLILEIVDADGISGWGECWHAPEAASVIIRTNLASAIIGEPSEDYGRLWDAMAARLGYDRHGTGIMALSGLDMAIWDLRARRLEVPLATLLGGVRRAAVLAYAAGPYFRPGDDPYRSYVEQASVFAAKGFRAIKMKTGVNPKRDSDAVYAVRKALGEDIALMVDINQGYTASAVIAAAERLEPFGVTWIEEPVMPADLAGYARIAQKTSIAIAGGEAYSGAAAFAQFITSSGAQIIQPDLSICGGFTEGMRIAALADVAGRAIVPHVWGTGINALASLQWVISLPERRGPASNPFPWFEFDQSSNPLRDIVPLSYPDEAGKVAAPLGPGLGVEIVSEHFAPYVESRWIAR